jgi:colanic acid biosynthesis glycosyl transferase WcaI
MRILYVSQYFPPEIGAPAARVHELSREWVRMGHQVTVLTGFPNHPTGTRYQGFDYGNGVLDERTVDGIRVVRTWLYFAANRGVYRRSLNYGSFMVSAVAAGLVKRLGRHDVLIATSPQILVGIAGWALSRLLGLPFVLEIRDIWPEAIQATGFLGGGLAFGVLKRTVQELYHASDALVGVTESFREQFVADGVPREKTAVIPNGVDDSLFRPGPRDNEWARAQGLDPTAFRVGYVGNIGHAQGIPMLVRAAEILRGDPVEVTVVGEGAERNAVQSLADGLCLPNFRLVGAQPRDRMPQVYASFDAVVVPLRRLDLFSAFVPSKIFEIMACGRPILAGLQGEARRLVVEEAGAGQAFTPDDEHALADAIRSMVGRPESAASLGAAGCRFVGEHYLRSTLAARYAEVLDRTCARHLGTQ